MIALEQVETDAEKLESSIIPVMQVASEIVVKDAPSYEMAGQVCKELTSLEKQVKLYWDGSDIAPGPVTLARRLKDSLTNRRDEMLDPLTAQKKTIVAGMKTFEDDQARIRRAEQARLEEEARKVAEEAALAQAVALEADGHKTAAEAVIASPVVAPAVYVPTNVPRGMGQFTKRTWGAEVTDLMVLVKAVAAGTVPIQAIEANSVFLNQQARALKSALAYPGVRAVEK